MTGICMTGGGLGLCTFTPTYNSAHTAPLYTTSTYSYGSSRGYTYPIPETPRTKEARWRAKKAEARWDTDAHQIRFYHAEEWRRTSEKIRADSKPHKSRRCRHAKREQRKLCKRDLADHHRRFMQKMVTADKSEVRRTTDHPLHLSIRPKWFNKVLSRGKPPSWPNWPAPRMSGRPTPAPWQQANPPTRRVGPRPITPFTRYLTPIPINVRKNLCGVTLTIPNNSDVKAKRVPTPLPSYSQFRPTSSEGSVDDVPKGILTNRDNSIVKVKHVPTPMPPRNQFGSTTTATTTSTESLQGEVRSGGPSSNVTQGILRPRRLSKPPPLDDSDCPPQ